MAITRPYQLDAQICQTSPLQRPTCHLRPLRIQPQQDPGCLEWLDGRVPGSVLYVNFGSIATLTEEQLVEFAWGLANSGREFLWILRPNIVGENSPVLPDEWLSEVSERGLIKSWCLQEEVLMHEAVGGFLTHCGWNSMIESISWGVPMICWPYFADQQPNCRYACNEWGVGMEIGNDVKRDEVEMLIKELFEGEKGKEMRKSALKWKESANKATESDGKSSLNLDRVIEDVLLRKN